MENFNKILKELIGLSDTSENSDYIIPGLWVNSKESIIKSKKIDYFINRFEKIKNTQKRIDFSQRIVYNMLMRYTTSFPHSNGIEFSNLSINFNESGSILKTISILPYIHSLGCNTLYLLPITEIGIDNKKGSLGSPYAIKNHYKIDKNLNEPFLKISIEDQFKALVEACHFLGIKIVLEFVFRTSSIDSDMAFSHPDWFYWVKYNQDDSKAFRPPQFDDQHIEKIKEKINTNDLTELPVPTKSYIDLYENTPNEVFLNGEKVFGKNQNGELLVIPSAFADWPPDDNQPLWSDVTYLKMHHHPNYNYIAYNTIRMYDEELTDEFKNSSLWDYLTGVIPYYQKVFNIDGVMIDMGHALPKTLMTEIIRKARENKTDFILWEENFSLSFESKEAGYNASLGYVCFDATNPWKMKEITQMLADKRSPIEFFLTPETHNTHRTFNELYNEDFLKMTLLALAFLPGVQFFHSGIEFCEQLPVNTGLGFTNDEIEVLLPEKLPLFSKSFMKFTDEFEIISFIKSITNFKYNHNIDLSFKNEFKLELIHTNTKVLIYILEINFEKYGIIANYELEKEEVIFDNFELVIVSDSKIKQQDNKLIMPPFTSALIRFKKDKEH